MREIERSFKETKDQIASASVLTHYNPSLPITLAAEASAYGVGTVIYHVFPDGCEHPIAFVSHTLTSNERNYAQLEKEALSLVFGVKKFHRYLYGQQFTLITDHQPLTTIRAEIAHGRILKCHVDQLKFWEKSSQAIAQPRMTSTDSTIADDYQYPSADQSHETQEPTQSPERRRRGDVVS